MKNPDKCPICGTELEEILDEDNFVIDYFCPECCSSWDLDDLVEPVEQKTMEDFFK